jgi:dTMP kinase
MPEKGRFIVLEGADGCGKSTQAARLVEWLRSAGKDVLHVRDPGSTGLSEAVRKILLDPATGRLGVEVIRPALDAGRVVICERWTLSTEVYQGVAGGLGAGAVRRMGGVATGGTEPSLTIVFDVAVGGGLARITRAKDRMESKDDAFHAKVVRGYRRLAKGRAKCVLVAPGAVDDVAARVRQEVASVAG